MPKPFVFTLMPFHPSFDDVYKLGIKAAVEEAGGYCERVDEQVYEERMLDRIYNQINKADFIIADVTGRNPNVFYEIGYAHALNKKVILMTADENDIPFDLKHHYHIVYNNKILHLKEQLIPRLYWYFTHPVAKLSTINQLNFYIANQKIENGTTINVKSENLFGDSRLLIKIVIEIENFTDIIYRDRFLIGIIITGNNGAGGDSEFFKFRKLNSGDNIFTTIKFVEEILPSDHIFLPQIRIYIDDIDKTIPLKMRIIKETSVSDIEFKLQCSK